MRRIHAGPVSTNVTVGTLSCFVAGSMPDFGSITVATGKSHLDFIMLGTTPPFPYCTGTSGCFQIAGISMKQPAGRTATIPRLATEPIAPASGTMGIVGNSTISGAISFFGTVNRISTTAGASVAAVLITNIDSTAGVTYLSRFYTEQLGAGSCRTLFYAASPTMANTGGEFHVLAEVGAHFALKAIYTTGSGSTVSTYNSAGNPSAAFNGILGQITASGTAFATLGTPANGTIGYCTDCDAPTVAGTNNICPSAGAKAGAEAHRNSGGWLCF